MVLDCVWLQARQSRRQLRPLRQLLHGFPPQRRRSVQQQLLSWIPCCPFQFCKVKKRAAKRATLGWRTEQRVRRCKRRRRVRSVNGHCVWLQSGQSRWQLQQQRQQLHGFQQQQQQFVQQQQQSWIPCCPFQLRLQHARQVLAPYSA